MDDISVHTGKEIGAAVRERRRASRFTQDELAAYTGVGRRFVIELEDGKPSLRLDKLLAVLNALGLRLKLGAP